MKENFEKFEELFKSSEKKDIQPFHKLYEKWEALVERQLESSIFDESNKNLFSDLEKISIKNLILLPKFIKIIAGNNQCDEIRYKLKRFDELLTAYKFFKEKTSKFTKEEVHKKISEWAKNTKDLKERGMDFFCVVSHAPKFSNPNCNEPRLLFNGKRENNGFLITGNVNYYNLGIQYDMHIFNATHMPGNTFLFLKISGKTILDHLLSEDTAIIEQFLQADKDKIQEWSRDFLWKYNENILKTDSSLRQVYFPIKSPTDDYHLLSILYPSPLVFELKTRIDKISNLANFINQQRFSEEKYFFDEIFCEINNISLQRFGGDHPENISILNFQHKDVYLLPCEPPKLEKIYEKISKVNFFNCLTNKNFYEIFIGFHNVILACTEEPMERNNIIKKYLNKHPEFSVSLEEKSKKISPKSGILPYHLKLLERIFLEEIIEKIVEKIYRIRYQEKGWSKKETFKELPEWQKIMLDEQRIEERRSEPYYWFDDFVKYCSSWIIRTYRNKLKTKELPLTVDHERRIKRIIKIYRESIL